MGQGIIISMLMFVLLRMLLEASGDNMGRRGKRKKKFSRQANDNNNKNNGGFAAVDNTAKKLDKKNKKNKTPARIPAPFESIVIPQAKDMKHWLGD